MDQVVIWSSEVRDGSGAVCFLKCSQEAKDWCWVLFSLMEFLSNRERIASLFWVPGKRVRDVPIKQCFHLKLWVNCLVMHDVFNKTVFDAKLLDPLSSIMSLTDHLSIQSALQSLFKTCNYTVCDISTTVVWKPGVDKYPQEWCGNLKPTANIHREWIYVEWETSCVQ